MALVLPFLLLFGLLFLMNRGEKKKRAALESKLKRGDRVITRSGIKGKLVEVSDAAVKVEIAPGVNVMMVKAAVEGLDTSDPVPAGKSGGKETKGGGKGKGGRDAKGAKGEDESGDADSGQEKKKRKWF
ncbi:MAG: preprotein translocase subunit YajC [Deltaproteobacteria bacterium]|jgi:preprotein translocase subunit YajC|nr:preprotein translocase subunit YajC [Deltaproteobacteria bacterium]MBW2529861.1 preprotein translocase subunit YajC [Deltaproteobacteria bacterium]